MVAVLATWMGWSTPLLAQPEEDAQEQAPPSTLVYSAFELAAGSLALSSASPPLNVPDGAGLKVIVDDQVECAVGVQRGALVRDGDCDALWLQSNPRPVSLSFPAGQRLTLTPAAVTATPGELPVVGDAVDTLGVMGPGDGLVIYTREGWRAYSVGGEGLVALDEASLAAVSEEAPVAFSERAGDQFGLFRWRLVLATAEGGESGGDSGSPEEGDGAAMVEVGDETRGFCRLARRQHAARYVICVDAAEPDAKVKLPVEGPVVRPDKSIVVVVRLRAEHTMVMQLSGQRGVFVPGARGGDQEDGGGRTRGAGDDGFVVPTYRTVEQVFPPRLPGAADLEVTVRRPRGGFYSNVRVELIIDRTYSSALRVGFGGVFLGAVDREFDAQTQPGAGQAEIVATGSQSYDLELVLGFAPFLERGGRSYASPSLARFAPYIGVGLLSQGGGGGGDAVQLEFFKSLHLGVEWELNPTFSVALTGVLRRVDRLSPGLRIGGPVEGNNVPTVERQALGLGLVINISPEFLRFGKRAVGGAGGGGLF